VRTKGQHRESEYEDTRHSDDRSDEILTHRLSIVQLSIPVE